MPESKKRKKKTRNKTSTPPVAKAELATKKKKITKQQILIYVFSALIIGSLAISFLIGGLGGGPTTPSQTGSQSEILLTPEASSQDVETEATPSEDAPAAEEK